jgi:hypothetical protein
MFGQAVTRKIEYGFGDPTVTVMVTVEYNEIFPEHEMAQTAAEGLREIANKIAPEREEDTNG